MVTVPYYCDSTYHPLTGLDGTLLHSWPMLSLEPTWKWTKSCCRGKGSSCGAMRSTSLLVPGSVHHPNCLSWFHRLWCQPLQNPLIKMRTNGSPRDIVAYSVLFLVIYIYIYKLATSISITKLSMRFIWWYDNPPIGFWRKDKIMHDVA